MPTIKNAATSLDQLTDAQRKDLAAKIVKERENGRSWDGDNGIVNDARFPLIKSAGQGRKLLIEAGRKAMIAKSYDRTAKGLTGPRVTDAKPKTTAKAAKPAAKKATTKAAPKTRTRKAASASK